MRFVADVVKTSFQTYCHLVRGPAVRQTPWGVRIVTEWKAVYKVFGYSIEPGIANRLSIAGNSVFTRTTLCGYLYKCVY